MNQLLQHPSPTFIDRLPVPHSLRSLAMFLREKAPVKSGPPQKLPTASNWPLSQTKEIRDICANLTPEENTRLLDHLHDHITNKLYWSAWLGALLLAGALVIFSWQMAVPILALYTICFFVLLMIRTRAWQRRVTELLCETKWARIHGITPENLSRIKYPWIS